MYNTWAHWRSFSAWYTDSSRKTGVRLINLPNTLQVTPPDLVSKAAPLVAEATRAPSVVANGHKAYPFIWFPWINNGPATPGEEQQLYEWYSWGAKKKLAKLVFITIIYRESRESTCRHVVNDMRFGNALISDMPHVCCKKCHRICISWAFEQSSQNGHIYIVLQSD